MPTRVLASERMMRFVMASRLPIETDAVRRTGRGWVEAGAVEAGLVEADRVEEDFDPGFEDL